jgi:hypothetical protein
VTRLGRQGAACRRAGALARGLRRDVEDLLGYGLRPRAAEVRVALARIDHALGDGLRFRDRVDAELGYRRGHARNVALVLRRTLEESLVADAASRAELLARAVRLADELAGTASWIGRRALEMDEPPPYQPWTVTWAGRLVGLAARLLPAELRLDFVEDQCGNLACAGSRRERAAYVVGLLARAPAIAAAAARGRAAL